MAVDGDRVRTNGVLGQETEERGKRVPLEKGIGQATRGRYKKQR